MKQKQLQTMKKITFAHSPHHALQNSSSLSLFLSLPHTHTHTHTHTQREREREREREPTVNAFNSIVTTENQSTDSTGGLIVAEYKLGK